MRKQHRLLNRVEKRDLEVEVLIGTMDYQRRIESDIENPEQEIQEDAGKLITSVNTTRPRIEIDDLEKQKNNIDAKEG